MVNGSFLRGLPRKVWNEIIRSDLRDGKVRKNQNDRNTWKSFIRNQQTHVNMEKYVKIR